MRKLVAGGITALIAGGALLAGPGSAMAAPAPAQAAVQQSSAAVGPAKEAAYEYYTWYWAQDTCESEGAKLQVRGVISNYYCQQSVYTTWYLYVLYR